MRVYAMLDKKKAVFDSVLMLAHSDGHVVRSIKESFTGSNHTIEKFPEDFDLYEVAEFAMDSGQVLPSSRFVCNVGVVLNGGGVNA